MSPTSAFQWRVLVPMSVLIVAGVLVWWVLIGPPSGSDQVPNGSDDIEPAVMQTPTPGEWATLTAGAGPSTVAIQTFQSGRIIRSGSGTAVSSDGLIATVIDVVPFTEPLSSYQVTIADNVFQAYVVRRDLKANLALVKIDTSGLTIAQMATVRPLIGTPLALIGGMVNVSSYVPHFVQGWLSADFGSYAVLDANPVPYVGGSRVLNADGRQIGIAFLRSGQVRMIWAEDIAEFIDAYLDSIDPAQ